MEVFQRRMRRAQDVPKSPTRTDETKSRRRQMARRQRSRRATAAAVGPSWTAAALLLVILLMVTNFPLSDRDRGSAFGWKIPIVSAQPQQQRRRTSSSTSADRLIPGNHTSNAAVLVSSSRFWHNYRHVSNVLSVYDILKNKGGMSDEDIILMIADDVPCNARNPYKNGIYPRNSDDGKGESLYDADVEIDYRGTDVTVDAFLRVLTGRHKPGERPSRTLAHLTPGTNILVYLTGHGGDQFFKFQDGEEVTAQDLASTFSQMKESGRYNDALFVADTCQAFTLDPTHPDVDGSDRVRDVTTFASSLKDQNSYAHHSDVGVGMSVVDRYTYHISEFVRGRRSLEGLSLRRVMFDGLRDKNLGADVGMNDGSSRRRTSQVPMCDFFCAKKEGGGGGSDGKVEVLHDRWEFGQMGGEKAAVAAVASRTRRLEPTQGNDSSGEGAPKDRFGDRNVGKKQVKYDGMHSSDPRFLLCAVGLLVAVRLASSKG